MKKHQTPPLHNTGSAGLKVDVFDVCQSCLCGFCAQKITNLLQYLMDWSRDKTNAAAPASNEKKEALTFWGKVSFYFLSLTSLNSVKVLFSQGFSNKQTSYSFFHYREHLNIFAVGWYIFSQLKS